MWNKLILTAGSDSQNQVFQKQLARIKTDNYAETTEVITDESPGIRIGSGGATLSVIRNELENYTNGELEKQKILLVHTGGLSQRMPHLSAYGKVFCTLPNHKTLLETKLDIYKNELIDKLPNTGGIMITASDVLENMETSKVIASNSDIVIFAHVSSIEVGTQHGVFVIDKKTNKLKRVLQKPTVEEMRREGAVREDGTVLTDSCYFMTWKLCKRLLESPLLREPVTEELCCYGDFMRPMGSEPKLDYIETSTKGLAKYRKALAEVFSKSTVEIATLREKSFFHFGTYEEFLESLLPISDFRGAFPKLFESNVVFCDGMLTAPKSSFVEFSSGTLEVGENSVVSGVDAGSSGLKLANDLIVFTLALATVN